MRIVREAVALLAVLSALGGGWVLLGQGRPSRLGEEAAAVATPCGLETRCSAPARA